MRPSRAILILARAGNSNLAFPRRMGVSTSPNPSLGYSLPGSRLGRSQLPPGGET